MCKVAHSNARMRYMPKKKKKFDRFWTKPMVVIAVVRNDELASHQCRADGTGSSCLAVLPLALHVLTAAIFASHRSSSVP